MFGSHLSISGGLHNALLAAEKLSCTTVQIFTKNQQQWNAKPLEESAIAEFRSHAERLQFSQIVAYDSYLINLASNNPALRQKSIDAFVEEIRRCDLLHVPFLVTHPGAHVGTGDEAGLDAVVQSLNTVIEALSPTSTTTVLLETTAGQGTCLGCTFEHLAHLLTSVKHPHRFGVCLDTCHVLAAGYDITTAEKTQNVLAQFDRIIGLQHLKAFHLNDSKKPLASRVDRHEHLGRGHVGLAAFQVICQDPRFKNTPKILETPKDLAPNKQEWDEINLTILRNFANHQPVILEVFKEAPSKKSNSKKSKSKPKNRPKPKKKPKRGATPQTK